jgi:hypothetical protein
MSQKNNKNESVYYAQLYSSTIRSYPTHINLHKLLTSCTILLTTHAHFKSIHVSIHNPLMCNSLTDISYVHACCTKTHHHDPLILLLLTSSPSSSPADNLQSLPTARTHESTCHMKQICQNQNKLTTHNPRLTFRIPVSRSCSSTRTSGPAGSG